MTGFVCDLFETFKRQLLEIVDILQLQLLPSLISVLVDAHVAVQSATQVIVGGAHFIEMHFGHLAYGRVVLGLHGCGALVARE